MAMTINKYKGFKKPAHCGLAFSFTPAPKSSTPHLISNSTRLHGWMMMKTQTVTKNNTAYNYWIVKNYVRRKTV